jgi:gliding motility-associated-like protein
MVLKNNCMRMKQILLLVFILNAVFLFAQREDKQAKQPLDINAVNAASTVVIPNVFTPNGDGINEVFKIDNAGLVTISCKIYSRWGVLIAELNAPNQVWDGYTTAGVICTSGTYFYVFVAKGVDDIDYNLRGFIQLIR